MIKLSAYQQTVSQMVADGFSQQEIADILRRPKKSVEECVRSVKNKLLANNSPNMVAILIRNGMVK